MVLHDSSNICSASYCPLKKLKNFLYFYIFQDFHLRRQMLLQRLDVTIRSFLWGEKGQGKEGEIVAAIMAQRDHLSEMPVKYTVIHMHIVTVAPLFLR
jgi:Protein of unknown function (DUF2465)